MRRTGLALASFLAGTTVLAGGRDLRVTFGGSTNPAGIQNSVELSWKWSLYVSNRALLKDSHISLGVASHLSPAQERLSAWVELSPLSVLDLRVGAEPVAYFGTFGALVPYPAYDADFGKDVREARRNEAVSGVGIRLYAAPTLKIRAGPFVAAGMAEFERWEVDAPGAYFYEPSRDTLLSSKGETCTRYAALLSYERSGQRGRKLLVGGDYRLTRVPAAPRNRVERAGLVAGWVFGDRRFGVGTPAVRLSVFRYLGDPSKDGELGAALSVAFSPGAH